MKLFHPLHRLPILHVVLWLLVAVSAINLVTPASAAPPACDPKATTDRIVKSDKIPCDFTGTMTAEALARFAWNTFIPMSWPAQDPFAEPCQRGIPQGTYGSTTPSLVWDSWREKRELYQIRKNGSGGFHYVQPPTWDDGQPPSSTGPNPEIKACHPGVDPPQHHITALQHNKIENYLDETDEIGLAVLWRNTSPLPRACRRIQSEVILPPTLLFLCLFPFVSVPIPSHLPITYLVNSTKSRMNLFRLNDKIELGPAISSVCHRRSFGLLNLYRLLLSVPITPSVWPRSGRI